ncbi:MAG: adenylate/guanylate cyclase domain-containing protein [Limnospira sp. PMC 1291.21]|uniref:Adenylate cyclase n=3 Tax=Limnospira TaxID=2596745 RepID=A0A9P1KE05_9CYAN|nr:MULTISPECIES: adenylate/guanylate cyclase domain-containing protein [Limnospira]MDC0838408.1 adenylate/guanylate cyclase domain-containing protein [Limnoraphis robusta]MDY7054335.1 adenylate/guanylate cyclase domain-containing protein [Limnospira fusiformis LS22]QJB27590.1 adenylate/guanylate cyclase domain-containing protein [Limnospira fusiformis SAG 85.79]EDZ96835.1 adenylate/guanylate cyclase [Limnospira maxima CS-328]MDT9178882.1 adenylate/guanylate cyclase domain-containing protein [L
MSKYTPGDRQLGPWLDRTMKQIFKAPDIIKAANYQTWQHSFMRQRLGLGLWLALIVYLTFSLSQIKNWLFYPQDFRLDWLITQVCVQLGVLVGLVLLRTAIGRQYPGLIFLLLSWMVTLSPQIRATFLGISQPAIIEWPLMFFSQATLLPICWWLHLISQLGVLLYYFGTQIILDLPVRLPVDWMTQDFLVLYFFWICVICNLSVYLYDRLAHSEFNSRKALVTAYEQVKQEQENSEKLLLNILPYPIAERLKQDPKTIADDFTDAGVLFADIVGFTEISTRFSPTDLVQLLNGIFSRFDGLAEQHGLEKIKTIGDAYMVVSGLPLPRDNYAEAIADMALDMQRTLREFNRQHQQGFKIRIGIATGPVIAGVIGLKKFIYDLWGDTVNIASRMESHGIADEIQVTEETYMALCDRYIFEKRGTIPIKGKGEMTTYLLKGKRE